MAASPPPGDRRARARGRRRRSGHPRWDTRRRQAGRRAAGVPPAGVQPEAPSRGKTGAGKAGDSASARQAGSRRSTAAARDSTTGEGSARPAPAGGAAPATQAAPGSGTGGRRPRPRSCRRCRRTAGRGAGRPTSGPWISGPAGRGWDDASTSASAKRAGASPTTASARRGPAGSQRAGGSSRSSQGRTDTTWERSGRAGAESERRGRPSAVSPPKARTAGAGAARSAGQVNRRSAPSADQPGDAGAAPAATETPARRSRPRAGQPYAAPRRGRRRTISNGRRASHEAPGRVTERRPSGDRRGARGRPDARCRMPDVRHPQPVRRDWGSVARRGARVLGEATDDDASSVWRAAVGARPTRVGGRLDSRRQLGAGRGVAAR